MQRAQAICLYLGISASIDESESFVFRQAVRFASLVPELHPYYHEAVRRYFALLSVPQQRQLGDPWRDPTCTAYYTSGRGIFPIFDVLHQRHEHLKCMFFTEMTEAVPMIEYNDDYLVTREYDAHFRRTYHDGARTSEEPGGTEMETEVDGEDDSPPLSYPEGDDEDPEETLHRHMTGEEMDALLEEHGMEPIGQVEGLSPDASKRWSRNF